MTIEQVTPGLAHLTSSLQTKKYTAGSTHNFYLYPARFSPEIARAIINCFSDAGDWVLDPFMGGGTTIIEGLSLGRRMIGVDLNALACFVAAVRTKPLSAEDARCVRQWAIQVTNCRDTSLQSTDYPHLKNLPRSVSTLLARAVARLPLLAMPRQRAFARCVLLRLGQWALDCRDVAAPTGSRLAAKLPHLLEQMLTGMDIFVQQCQQAGVHKNEIVGRRLLLCRSAAGLHDDPRIAACKARPRLVFTSPPYPRVHVLYHRWQVRGRKETPAPYWIAQIPDGFFASHYTGGSRSPSGERRYFGMITSTFVSVRKLVSEDALVVQLVGFADLRAQLPRYLDAMREAGFEEWTLPLGHQRRLRRRVPNRKWHAKLKGPVDASSEILLFHRPR